MTATLVARIISQKIPKTILALLGLVVEAAEAVGGEEEEVEGGVVSMTATVKPAECMSPDVIPELVGSSH